MSEIGVVHMDLGSKGGGEAVCMNVLAALQDRHELTLLTLTDPDVPALNDYFDTDVDGAALTIRRAGVLAPAIQRAFGIDYYVLQNALLGRYVRRHADEFDLLISTINELGLGPDAIQYIHFPFDWAANGENREEIFHPTIEDGSPYERLCSAVAGLTQSDVRANTLFANSAWTADAVEDAYGVRPQVLHPPVDTREFTDRPWDDREAGFVTVGRIERSKRVVEQIEIVDGLRDRGHDVDLHVVGPTVDPDYRAEVEALAADRPHVVLEGEVSRSRLVELICAHRYGLHGKQYEHFGMAVAELAAGGAIPFVPASGGPGAIVREPAHQTYESVSDAVETIDRVLGDSALQAALQPGHGEIERRFGRERFRDRVRRAVDAALGRTDLPEPRPTADTPASVASDATD